MIIACDASKATTESTFFPYMEKLKEAKQVSWRELNAKPHKLWENYADRGNMTWNQSKSNMSESVNNMIGAESRTKPVLPLLAYIVLKTVSRIDMAARQKDDDTKSGRVFVWPGGILRLHSGRSLLRNRVTLRFGNTQVDQEAAYERKSSKVFDFMDTGFRLGHYRSAASDPRFKIALPVLSDVSRNSAHRAPLRVDGQAGRTKSKRATKRKASNGEYNTSSRYNRIQKAPRTNRAHTGSVPAAGPSCDGGNSNPPILSKSSSSSQDSTSGAPIVLS